MVKLYGQFEDELEGEFTFFSINTDGTGFQALSSSTSLGGIATLFPASDGNLWDTNFSNRSAPDGSVFTLGEDGTVLQSFGLDLRLQTMRYRSNRRSQTGQSRPRSSDLTSLLTPAHCLPHFQLLTFGL